MARFVSRPNRFIAHCVLDNGESVVCHVKNTGRCRELLTENAAVVLEKSENFSRKTAYDLISVYKGNRLINMDSNAPNKVFSEYIPHLFPNATLIKPEYTIKSSRIDFYIESDGKKILAEVKGVTLESDGVVLFPDAPTERGIKHINELIAAKSEGYECYIVFVVQMSDVLYFTPNYATHPQFGEALKRAFENGVNVLALECEVSRNSLSVSKPLKFML